jgi:hypothetical protein
MPPPHVRVHADHALHAPSWQSTAQGCSLQSSVSSRAGHAGPPASGWRSTPTLAMYRFGATRRDMMEKNIHYLVWQEKWIQQEPNQPLVKTTVRRDDPTYGAFAGTELAPLFALQLGWDDYPGEPVPQDGTILHALERLIPFAAEHAGFVWTTTHFPEVQR